MYTHDKRSRHKATKQQMKNKTSVSSTSFHIDDTKTTEKVNFGTNIHRFNDTHSSAFDVFVFILCACICCIRIRCSKAAGKTDTHTHTHVRFMFGFFVAFQVSVSTFSRLFAVVASNVTPFTGRLCCCVI